jgi:hypothetical protein
MSLGVLDDAVKKAPSIFPQLLKIGKVILGMAPERFYDICDKICESGIDQRLAMQYALSIVAVEEVRCYSIVKNYLCKPEIL